MNIEFLSNNFYFLQFNGFPSAFWLLLFLVKSQLSIILHIMNSFCLAFHIFSLYWDLNNSVKMYPGVDGFVLILLTHMFVCVDIRFSSNLGNFSYCFFEYFFLFLPPPSETLLYVLLVQLMSHWFLSSAQFVSFFSSNLIISIALSSSAWILYVWILSSSSRRTLFQLFCFSTSEFPFGSFFL